MIWHVGGHGGFWTKVAPAGETRHACGVQQQMAWHRPRGMFIWGV